MYYSHDGDGMGRRNIRVLLEAGIRETGSLRDARERIEHRSRSVELHLWAIESEADAFGKQFEIQAADFARLMLARGMRYSTPRTSTRSTTPTLSGRSSSGTSAFSARRGHEARQALGRSRTQTRRRQAGHNAAG